MIANDIMDIDRLGEQKAWQRNLQQESDGASRARIRGVVARMNFARNVCKGARLASDAFRLRRANLRGELEA